MEDSGRFGLGNRAAFNARDADALAAMSHPDMVTTVPSFGHGIEATIPPKREHNHSWFDGFPDGRVSATSQVIEGEYVVQKGTFEGTNTGSFKTESGSIPATGRRLKARYSQVSRVKKGVIVSTNLYFHRVEK